MILQGKEMFLHGIFFSREVTIKHGTQSKERVGQTLLKAI
jgi:hypothetical protein